MQSETLKRALRAKSAQFELPGEYELWCVPSGLSQIKYIQEELKLQKISFFLLESESYEYLKSKNVWRIIPRTLLGAEKSEDRS